MSSSLNGTTSTWTLQPYGWVDLTNKTTIQAFTSGTSFSMSFYGVTYNGTLTSNFIADGDNGSATISWTGTAPTLSDYQSPSSVTIGGVTYNSKMPEIAVYDYSPGQVGASDAVLQIQNPSWSPWVDVNKFNLIKSYTTGTEVSVSYNGVVNSGVLSSGFAQPDAENQPDMWEASVTWSGTPTLSNAYPDYVQTLTIQATGGGGGTTYNRTGNWNSPSYWNDQGDAYYFRFTLTASPEAGLLSALNALNPGDTIDFTAPTGNPTSGSFTVVSISGQPYAGGSFVDINTGFPDFSTYQAPAYDIESITI
jgi:hypothetical protein